MSKFCKLPTTEDGSSRGIRGIKSTSDESVVNPQNHNKRIRRFSRNKTVTKTERQNLFMKLGFA